MTHRTSNSSAEVIFIFPSPDKPGQLRFVRSSSGILESAHTTQVLAVYRGGQGLYLYGARIHARAPHWMKESSAECPEPGTPEGTATASTLTPHGVPKTQRGGAQSPGRALEQ